MSDWIACSKCGVSAGLLRSRISTLEAELAAAKAERCGDMDAFEGAAQEVADWIMGAACPVTGEHDRFACARCNALHLIREIERWAHEALAAASPARPTPALEVKE